MNRTKDLLLLFDLIRCRAIPFDSLALTWHQFTSSSDKRSLAQLLREKLKLPDFKVQQHIEEVVKRVERHSWSETDALADLLREIPIGDQIHFLQLLSTPPEEIAVLEPGQKYVWETRYRRDTVVGQGGVGVVWQATDVRAGRRVAIKTLREGAHGRPKDLDRFHAEARISACLEHPNIIPIYDLWEGASPGNSGYCMRLLGKQTLHDAIEEFHRPRRGKSDALAFSKLLETILDVCKGIEYAHSRGVIHRDLKPANIAIGDFGEVIILDWGLAKVLRPDEAFGEVVGTTVTTSTGLRGIVGTPAFMAPEQAWGKPETVGPAADVFALGGILFHLLTGRPPRLKRANASLRELIEEIAKSPIPSPRSIDDRIFPKLDAICMRALSYLPHERFASAAEFADELRRYQNGQPLTTYREGWFARSRRGMLRHRAATVAAFSSTLFAIVSTFLLLFLFRFVDQTLVATKTQQLATLLNLLDTAFEFQQGRIQTILDDLQGDASLHAVLTGNADPAEARRVAQRLANQFSSRDFLLHEEIVATTASPDRAAVAFSFPTDAPAESRPRDPTRPPSPDVPLPRGTINYRIDVAPIAPTNHNLTPATFPVLKCESPIFASSDSNQPVGNVFLTATMFPLTTAEQLPMADPNKLLFCDPQGKCFASMSWPKGRLETKGDNQDLAKAYPEILPLLKLPDSAESHSITIERADGSSVVAVQPIRSPQMGLTAFLVAAGPLDRVSHHQLAPMFIKLALALSVIALVSAFFVAYLLSSPLLPANSPRRERHSIGSRFRRRAVQLFGRSPRSREAVGIGAPERFP